VGRGGGEKWREKGDAIEVAKSELVNRIRNIKSNHPRMMKISYEKNVPQARFCIL